MEHETEIREHWKLQWSQNKLIEGRLTALEAHCNKARLEMSEVTQTIQTGQARTEEWTEQTTQTLAEIKEAIKPLNKDYIGRQAVRRELEESKVDHNPAEGETPSKKVAVTAAKYAGLVALVGAVAAGVVTIIDAFR